MTLHAILAAVTQIQNDIKMLDAKFSNQISAIFDTISVSVASSDKEKIHQLDNERQDHQATIDMLMNPRGDNGHLNQPHYVSREFYSTPHTIHSSNAVTTQNRFAVLSTDDIKDDTSEDSVTEAERLIDSYYDILIPNHEAETKKPRNPS